MTDKECIRHLKADMVGRLIACAMVFAGMAVFGTPNSDKNGKDGVRVTKKMPVNREYNDSVPHINSVMQVPQKSR